jgi:hypothetical protein
MKTKRRRILQQLNKGEDRHKLARAVFHGKRGELRQRYHEGQEDQLGALGLVVNIIVLWNTIYINAALQQLEQEGFEIQSEDIARLSPLPFEHINVLGKPDADLLEVHIYRRGHPMYMATPGNHTRVLPLARRQFDRVFLANSDSIGPVSNHINSHHRRPANRLLHGRAQAVAG